MERALSSEPLTVAAFAPFGDVIAAADGDNFIRINDGNCKRFNDLARVRCHGGETALSIFRADIRRPPFAISMLERHPLGTQAFIPLGDSAYLVVVAPPAGDVPDWGDIRVFAANRQGVNFHVGVWHHPLFVIGGGGDFLVADRVGEGDNCAVQTAPEGSRFRIRE